jgi:hypothetical protein
MRAGGFPLQVSLHRMQVYLTLTKKISVPSVSSVVKNN